MTRERGCPPVRRIALALCAVLAAAVALIAGAIAPTGNVAQAAPSDETADAVFGQAGLFTINTCNMGGLASAATLCGPSGMAFDSAGNLYVADYFNNRVLGYNTPLTTDFVADRVFGQLGSFATSTANNGGVSANSLFNPLGVVLDASDNLYVVDGSNNRVLEYDTPISTDTTADRVFGQGGSFATNSANMGGSPSADTLSAPGAAYIDAPGNLWVSDRSNNRVLVYYSPLADSTADFVLGQLGSFTTGSCNLGGSAYAFTLCQPSGIAIDRWDHVYIADFNNNRVLQYDGPLASGITADRVLGQGGSFNTTTCNNGGISASSLCNPGGLLLDGAGNLFVADYNNNRTLVFADPIYMDTAADRVIGQGGSFSSNTCNNGGVSATSQCLPLGMELDAAQNLFVTDLNNHRVLEYDAPVDFVVNSSNDVNDGTCNAAHCSLREAINAANSASGFNAIEFSIGSGIVTIAPTSALPTITDVVSLDATTQPGYTGVGAPVELRGDSAGGGANGLDVTAGTSLLRGMWINRFAADGVRLTTNGSNVVLTVYAGRDIFGTVQPNGGDGMFVNTPNNSIGGGLSDREANILSGNSGNGVRISGAAASGNLVINNAIGTNGGLTNLDQGNSLDGVRIEGAPSNTVYFNVLSGNESDGVEINGAAASGNLVRGNVIGTDRFGNLDLGNTQNGVRIVNAPGNTIGLSSQYLSGNVISGNGAAGIDGGILIEGSGATGNIVRGNAIGTNIAGTAAISNFWDGILIDDADSNIIGGSNALEGNLISGNLNDGVEIFNNSAFNTVAGNAIGTNITGTAAIPNRNGVVTDTSGPHDNVIGGSTNLTPGACTGSCNLISGNTGGGDGHGVWLIQGTDTTVTGNFIGTNLAGTAPLPNSGNGILIHDGTHTISQNVISSNGSRGITFSSAFGGVMTDTIIRSNFIGTDVHGANALPNTAGGISVAAASGTIIGGAAAGQGNLISGNGSAGVTLTGSGSTGAVVKGNTVGISLVEAPLANGAQGILINGGANGNTVGGTGAGDGNTIATNATTGVTVDGGGSTGNAIRGNAVYANVSLGIATTGGSNGGIAAPVVAPITTSTVTGTIAGCPTCQIDVYSDGASQGRVYQGSTTASGGAWSFTGPIAGPNVTATATDGSGNTSQFSSPVPVNLFREAGSTGNPGFAGDGMVANSAPVRLDGPHGLAKYSGNLYFADTNNNRIRTITPNAPSGTINTVAGNSSPPTTGGFGGDGGAATSALLDHPNDVAVASNGDFYIADTLNCRIRKVASSTITTVAGTGTCSYNGDGIAATTAQLNHPHGVAVDGSGNIFIADTDNHRIRKISGGVITTIAGTGTAGFIGDGGLATSASLRRPYDIVVSPLGAYIIADTDNSIIRSIDIGSGIITRIAGRGPTFTGYNGDGIPAVDAYLDHPEQVAADADGDIYIADTNHNRVRHINAVTGIIQTAVGSGLTGTSDPDAVDAYVAHLDHPAGVVAGSVTVADTGNHIIRTVPTNNDPTGAPDPPRPGSGNFCTQKFGTPLAGIADWTVIAMTVGLIAGHRRVRWLFRLLTTRRRRPALTAA